MNKRHISQIYSDAISITQVRRNIGILLTKLVTEKEVKVLRGQEVLFIASSPEIENKKKAAKQQVKAFFSSLREKHHTSLSEQIISEREKMTSKTYYEKGGI